MTKNRRHFTQYVPTGNKSSLCGSQIFDLDIDNNQSLWIATLNDGLCRLDLAQSASVDYTERFIRYDLSHPSSSLKNHNSLQAVYARDDGSLWVGTMYSGVNVLQNRLNTFRHFDHNDSLGGLPSNNIWPIIEDHENNLWLGAVDAGLLKYDDSSDSFLLYEFEDDNVNSYKIFDLYQDSQKNLWVATNDGVKWVKLGTMEMVSFRVEDGLSHNNARGIVEDNLGYIWISTNAGLSRYSPVDSAFTNFYVEDGLQGNRFFARSAMKASDGRLFFGGSNGFNIIYPERLPTDTLGSKIVLKDIQVNNKPYIKSGELPAHLRENLVLEHDENRFSLALHIAQLYQRIPKQIQIPPNRNWQHVGSISLYIYGYILDRQRNSE